MAIGYCWARRIWILAALNRMTKYLEIDDDVTFVDFVSGDDKKYLLKNAQWLILPSKQENFGIVVLEALQHGCPVAISDQVFLADELGNGVVTLKLRMDEWIRFFSGKMVDESYRRSRVARGRELLFCNYSFQSIAELWTIAFEALFCQRRAY
jgi:glycosyltransferase involved in cell wall biosynthesis